MFPKISLDNYKNGCISGQKALIIDELACTERISFLPSNLAHLLHYYMVDKNTRSGIRQEISRDHYA